MAADLKHRLEQMDYNIVGICNNEKDALKKCKETNPNLVLISFILKGDLDGIETAQIIHNIYKIPHIYITDKYDKKTFKKAETTNPYCILTKPFDDTELKNSIQMVILNL